MVCGLLSITIQYDLLTLYVILKTLDFFKRFSPHLHFFLTFNDTNYLQKKNIYSRKMNGTK